MPSPYPITREGPKSGIYEIRRADGGRCYLGSSKRLWSRWVQHRRDLRLGTHHNQHLQRAWDLYGDLQFQMFVLEECDPTRLFEREHHHVSSRDPASLYNTAEVNPTGSWPSRKGLTNSPSHRARSSQALMGRSSWNKGGKNTWAAKAEASRVAGLPFLIEAVHLDGQRRTFPSPAAAARVLSCVRKSVCNILHGRAHRTQSGWTFHRIPKPPLQE